MSEWPKTAEEVHLASTDEIPEGELLIPADLGRELYRAAQELLEAFDDGLVHDFDKQQSAEYHSLLARYEREVGK